MTESEARIAKAVELRLAHDAVVEGRFGNPDAVVDAEVSATAFLEAENALSIPEFNHYMTQYRARKVKT